MQNADMHRCTNHDNPYNKDYVQVAHSQVCEHLYAPSEALIETTVSAIV